MSLYLRLADVSLADLAQVGGKAATLGEALALGCPVPPGIVLSTALYRRFMLQGGLQGEIASILATMQPTAMTHFQAVEWAIQSAFRVRRIPDEIDRAIEEAWSNIGGGRVAVRSSATSEDSPQQSFVGQHETYLNVTDRNSLVEAVAGCWMSLYSAKALSYAFRFGVDLLKSSMAVLIQPMVDATVQGALVTVDPTTGNPDAFILEVQRGSRRETFSLDPYQREAGEFPPGGRLRQLGLKLDEHHAAYQAIRWIIDSDGELWFLRVRPVTGVQPYLPPTERETRRRYLPLELVAEQDRTARQLRPFSWYHQSRSPRLNSARYGRANRLLTATAGKDELYSSGYLYVRLRRFAVPAQRIRALTRLVPDLRRLRRAQLLDREFVRFWESGLADLQELTERNLIVANRRDLARQLERSMRLHEAFRSSLGAFGELDRQLAETVQTLHRLWLREEVDRELLMPFGDTGTDTDGRDKIDQRDILADIDRAASLSGPDGPAERRAMPWPPSTEPRDHSDAAGTAEGSGMRARREIVGRELADAESRVPRRLRGVRRRLYRTLLVSARRANWAKSCLCLGLGQCTRLERDAVLEVGRRLCLEGMAAAPEDAGLLGCREILDWLRGDIERDIIVRHLSERKHIYRRWARYAPPQILEGAARITGSQHQMRNLPGRSLCGQAVSPGVAGGPARVVSTLAEAPAVLPGEVLVCYEPLFELSPLFSLVSAVVSEQGGLLDHASVLAREYGVPAVFGVDGATREIHTGDDLHVDARSGTVTIVEPGEHWELDDGSLP